jgi:cell division protein FtsA
VATIKNVIEARMGEIIANVSRQLVNSDYSDKLLAGLILTGGGSSMKNVVKAFGKSTKIDKIRVANKVNPQVIKTSNAGNINLESARTATILSLLLAGTIPCGGETFNREPDIFDQQLKEEERQLRQKEAEAAAAAEAQDAVNFDNVKAEIRAAFEKVQKQIKELEEYGRDKKVRRKSQELALSVMDEVVGERYEKAVKALEGKDKFKQSLKEGADLADILQKSVEELAQKVNKANKENSAWGRLTNLITEIVSEDNN